MKQRTEKIQENIFNKTMILYQYAEEEKKRKRERTSERKLAMLRRQ